MTPEQRAAMELALEALKSCSGVPHWPSFRPVIADLTAALEQPAQQEPDQRLINLLCRIHRDGGHYLAKHGLDKAVADADIKVAELNAMSDTCHQAREWAGLTFEEKQRLNDALNLQGRFPVIDTIEAKLREKNNG